MQKVSLAKVSLTALADELMAQAAGSANGRSARTVYGGLDHELHHTVVALQAGRELGDHVSPGEGSIQVLRGRVRSVTGGTEEQVAAGEMIAVPDLRQTVEAAEDSVMLITVVKQHAADR